MSSDDEDLFEISGQQEPTNEQEELAQFEEYLKFDKIRLEKQVRGGSPNESDSDSTHPPIFPHNFVFHPPQPIQSTYDQNIISQVVNDSELLPKPPSSPFKKDSFSKRKARYLENKNFDVILSKMTKEEYSNQELIEMINEEFHTNINQQGLGKLKAVKTNFVAIRKTDKVTHKRMTFYKKK